MVKKEEENILEREIGNTGRSVQSPTESIITTIYTKEVCANSLPIFLNFSGHLVFIFWESTALILRELYLQRFIKNSKKKNGRKKLELLVAIEKFSSWLSSLYAIQLQLQFITRKSEFFTNISNFFQPFFFFILWYSTVVLSRELYFQRFTKK